MDFWYKFISRELAESLTEIIIFEWEEKFCVDFEKFSPPINYETYTDTLMKHKNRWFISYNDEIGSTHVAYTTVGGGDGNG